MKRPRDIYFITHPDVRIDPAVPVPAWPLSDRGRERMQRLLEREWVHGLGAIYCSTERKAIDGAEILSRATGCSFEAVAELGENDRSATGYLAKAEFETTANEFFARPQESVRGWERAVDAQARIVRAVGDIAARAPAAGPIAIVSHGGVGALLLCHLKQTAISRTEDQPANGGGNYFLFRMPDWALVHGWTRIDP